MAKASGGFIWYELITPDPDASAAFYGAVVGWTVVGQADAEGMDYRMIVRSDGGMAGGLMVLTSAMHDHGARPQWLGYLHVDDVDAEVQSVEAKGGKVLMAATDIPQGRFAMVADPQCAAIYLMNPVPPAGKPDATSDVFSFTQAQHVRWNELQSSDPEASVGFYTEHFGWKQAGDIDMGAIGKYRFVQQGDGVIGAIMPRIGDGPPSQWTFFFGVDDIDRAAAAITNGGGKLDGAINPIPGGEFSVHATDPQGAKFGIVGPRLTPA